MYVPLQHRYLSDPWRVIVVSMLLNLTSREHVRPILDDLFARWPTPEAMAGASPASLAKAVRATGLQEQKAARLIRMSKTFVTLPVLSTFHVEHLPGCGVYVADAFRVFCQGDYRMRPPTDKVLAEYVRERS